MKTPTRIMNSVPAEWYAFDRFIPIEDKMCLCFCPEELNVFQVASWDDDLHLFIDNDDWPVNASHWFYLTAPR
jgi:hypothetical protein